MWRGYGVVWLTVWEQAAHCVGGNLGGRGIDWCGFIILAGLIGSEWKTGRFGRSPSVGSLEAEYSWMVTKRKGFFNIIASL